MGKIAFGIDLGTTNSCIAYMTKGVQPKIITLSNGRQTLPSCVMFDGDRVIVGQAAYEKRYDTSKVVYSSKRFIGTDKVYHLHPTPDTTLDVTPTEVAGYILAELKRQAELQFGEVTEVVITVPAYFNVTKREATIAAARLAGLKVMALINEPTSAALAYTLGETTVDSLMVYDLGGGTFDITLLDIITTSSNNRSANILASAGNDHLGGDDIDMLTLEYALNSIDASPADLSPEEQELLLLEIEQYKKEGYPTVFSSTVKYKDKPIFVRRAHYDKAVHKVYALSRALIDQCMSQQPTKFSKIILVGGSTKLETIREELEEFEVPIYTGLNPDEAVALGAAVQSSVLIGDLDLRVSDILPQSIGVSCTYGQGAGRVDGRFKKLFQKNVSLPASASDTFETADDGQSEISIDVYQGEDTIARNNQYLGNLAIACPKEFNRGEGMVSVAMHIDASGILTVLATFGGVTKEVKLKNILNPSEAPKSMKDRYIQKYTNALANIQLDSRERAIFDELVLKVKSGELPLTELSIFVNNHTQTALEAATNEFNSMLSSLSSDVPEVDME